MYNLLQFVLSGRLNCFQRVFSISVHPQLQDSLCTCPSEKTSLLAIRRCDLSLDTCCPRHSRWEGDGHCSVLISVLGWHGALCLGSEVFQGILQCLGCRRPFTVWVQDGSLALPQECSLFVFFCFLPPAAMGDLKAGGLAVLPTT